MNGKSVEGSTGVADERFLSGFGLRVCEVGVSFVGAEDGGACVGADECVVNAVVSILVFYTIEFIKGCPVAKLFWPGDGFAFGLQ